MPKLNIVLGKSDDFRRVYTNVIRVQPTPTDYRLTFYLDCPREPVSEFVLGEKLKPREKVVVDRLSQVEVIIPLNVAKSLRDILSKNLQKLGKKDSQKNDKSGLIYT
ncbi:DUF3467 domain-containing protein [Candidatus Bathyarchaeota archaeon]|nr:DUF3467 domain-containing protein [Candidatus Bathyarchaeota archaeon]